MKAGSNHDTRDSDRPNFLIITTDQQRYDTLGVTGNDIVRTPHMDTLANEGVLFSNAFCQNTVCIPSRACLHTGKYIHQHGVQYMESEIETTPALPPWEKTFMERLQEAGYHTGAFGKIHMVAPKGYHETALTGGKGVRWTEVIGQDIGPAPLGQSYAAWLEARHPGGYAAIHEQRRTPEYRENHSAIINTLDEDEYVESWIAEEAKSFLRTRSGSSKPFMLWAGFCGPHPPFDPPRRYAEMYPVDEMPLPATFSRELAAQSGQSGGLSEANVRKIVAYYYAMMSCIDDKVGELVAELDRNGQRENTVIIITSDHGEMLGDRNRLGKGCFYDPVIRIPTIVYDPWVDRNLPGPPRIYGGLVETFSIAPTVLELAGTDRPVDMSAESLVPILAGAGSERACILCEFVPNDRSANELCLRTNGHKLILKFSTSHGRETQEKSGHELYDLDIDPLELNNRYGDPAYSEVKDDLKTQAIRRIFETSTPSYQSWLGGLPGALRRRT